MHLTLIRHAKSSWGEENLADINRPLAPRGIRQCHALGPYMHKRELKPDLWLCSPAKRARETAALLNEHVQYQGEIRIVDNLYGASANHLEQIIREYHTDNISIFITAHNPGLHHLIEHLTGKGLAKFPTAALAIMQFEESIDMPPQLTSLEIQTPKALFRI
jgi:phosphohistidine phosphatase